jgi:hypothetical protein
MLAANVLALGEEGDFTHKLRKYRLATEISTNFLLKAQARLFCQTLVIASFYLNF